jgi:hypothetical protein
MKERLLVVLLLFFLSLGVKAQGEATVILFKMRD